MKSLYRKKKNNALPSYLPNQEEQKWYRYCVHNNIRISPWGIFNDPDNWYININIGPYKRGEKQNLSPEPYDRKQIWNKYYEYCKYYYDKRKQ